MKAWLQSLGALELLLVALCASLITTSAIVATFVLCWMFRMDPEKSAGDEPD